MLCRRDRVSSDCRWLSVYNLIRSRHRVGRQMRTCARSTVRSHATLRAHLGMAEFGCLESIVLRPDALIGECHATWPGAMLCRPLTERGFRNTRYFCRKPRLCSFLTAGDGACCPEFAVGEIAFSASRPLAHIRATRSTLMNARGACFSHAPPTEPSSRWYWLLLGASPCAAHMG
jgi:hypothetical protein